MKGKMPMTKPAGPNGKVSLSRAAFACTVWHEYHVDPPQLYLEAPDFLSGQAIEWSVCIYHPILAA